jgi:ankyrin repeat protein
MDGRGAWGPENVKQIIDEIKMELDIDEVKLIILNNSLREIKEALNHFHIASFDQNGNNILHYFIKSDKSLGVNAENIVQLFVDAGIDINAKQAKMPKRTALQLVVLKRLRAVFDLLLREGVDVNLKDGDGNSALFHAGNDI